MVGIWIVEPRCRSAWCEADGSARVYPAGSGTTGEWLHLNRGGEILWRPTESTDSAPSHPRMDGSRGECASRSFLMPETFWTERSFSGIDLNISALDDQSSQKAPTPAF